jgi:hypothetical protein
MPAKAILGILAFQVFDVVRRPVIDLLLVNPYRTVAVHATGRRVFGNLLHAANGPS